MNTDIAAILSAVNTPGVRQHLAAEEGLDALAVGKFHAAFSTATKTMIDESQFRDRIAADLASGKYLESGLINYFANNAHYSLECESLHRLLADEFSYQIEGRPKIDGRSWYTRQERADAALLCATHPLIPLAHKMLLSLAADQLLDSYYRNPDQARRGDFTSFLIRWNPDNTTGELVPAVTIMLLTARGFPSSAEPRERIVQSASSTEIESAYRSAKDFIVNNGFFSLPLPDSAGNRIKVTCPGMTFMRTYWDIQADIHSALTRDRELPIIQKWTAALRDVYLAAQKQAE